MLKIHFGSMPEEIYNTSLYFDNTYYDNWFDDALTKKIIKSVDRAEVISPGAVNSKALGVIPVTKLSGGTKTLLLMRHKPGGVYNASTCGDNCARWILEIAKNSPVDIVINLHHIMDFGDRKFDAEILNNHVPVHTMDDILDHAHALLLEDAGI